MQKTNGRTIIIDTVDGLKEVLVAGGKCIYMASGVRGPRGPRGVPGQPGAAGNGIVSIVLLSAVGLNKTYRITFTNGTHFDYVVTDGEDGAPGEPGEPGKAATIAVGTVTTLPAGSSATVTNVGTESAAVLDFGIPEGEQGDPGASEWGSITGTLSDQTDLQSAIDSKADIITRSVSGSLVHIEDGAPRNVSALSVGIEPVQDLHGYANPWPAGGGANKFGEGTAIAGYVNVSGVIVGQSADKEYYMDYYPITAGAKYVVGYNKYASGEGKWLAIAWYDTNKDFISRATDTTNAFHVWTAPANAVYAIPSVATHDNGLDGCCFYQGETATFVPFENLCPISGWSSAQVTRTGKNLLSIDTVTHEANTGTIAIFEGSLTGRFTLSWDKSGVTSVTTTNAAIVTLVINGTTTPVAYQNDSYTFTGTLTKISVHSATSYAKWLGTVKFQLEVGSTVSSWQAYNGQQVTIALGDTYYGGTLDVLTGTLTVDREIVTLIPNGKDPTSENFWYTSAISNLNEKNDGVICNKLPVISNVYSGTTESGICWFANGIIRWVEVGTMDMSLNNYKTYLQTNPLIATYRLPSPQTVTLSPNQLSTLLGVNNVWADTGATSLTYRADTKMYIDEQVSAEAKAVRSILTSVEAEMKATKNYTAGQVLIVGDDLYKATANIANGATLTVGTNVTKVTMAEWILSLV